LRCATSAFWIRCTIRFEVTSARKVASVMISISSPVHFDSLFNVVCKVSSSSSPFKTWLTHRAAFSFGSGNGTESDQLGLTLRALDKSYQPAREAALRNQEQVAYSLLEVALVPSLVHLLLCILAQKETRTCTRTRTRTRTFGNCTNLCRWLAWRSRIAHGNIRWKVRVRRNCIESEADDILPVPAPASGSVSWILTPSLSKLGMDIPIQISHDKQYLRRSSAFSHLLANWGLTRAVSLSACQRFAYYFTYNVKPAAALAFDETSVGARPLASVRKMSMRRIEDDLICAVPPLGLLSIAQARVVLPRW